MALPAQANPSPQNVKSPTCFCSPRTISSCQTPRAKRDTKSHSKLPVVGYPIHLGYWYRWESQHRYSKNACVQVSVREADLTREIIVLLHRQAEILCGKYISLEQQAESKYDDAKLRTISQSLDKDGRMLRSLYESLVNGIISSDEFAVMKADYEARIETLSKQADEIRSERYDSTKQAGEYRDLADAVNAAIANNKLSAEIVNLLVEKILVNPDKSFEIVLRFQDEYREVCVNE